jgi:hypothetical protein
MLSAHYNRAIIAFCVLVPGLIFTPGFAQGQSSRTPGPVDASGLTYRRFAQPGEATLRILVVAGTSSGIYDVGVSTSLEELLILSGGQLLAPESAHERRKVTVRLLREHGGDRTIVYESPLAEMLRGPGRYPELHDGDLLQIEASSRQRIGWRERIQIVASIGTLALVVERVARSF